MTLFEFARLLEIFMDVEWDSIILTFLYSLIHFPSFSFPLSFSLSHLLTNHWIHWTFWCHQLHFLYIKPIQHIRNAFHWNLISNSINLTQIKCFIMFRICRAWNKHMYLIKFMSFLIKYSSRSFHSHSTINKSLLIWFNTLKSSQRKLSFLREKKMNFHMYNI